MELRENPDLAGIALGAEAAALTSDTAAAAGLYERLRPHDGRRVVGADPGLEGAAVAYYLGVLARTAGRLEAATAHLEGALGMHGAAGEEAWVARVRCELARVLLAQGDAASQRRALAHLDAVLEWPAGAGSPVSDEAAGLRARAERNGERRSNLIRREGEIWTIVFDGRTCRVRDSKGVRLLAMLLHHPGRPFPVLALAAEDDDGDATVGSAAGPAATERARVRVTRALRHALARIDALNPALGQHLNRTVHTGRLCAYTPGMPVEWMI
jgi:hypothetical protein